MQNTKCIDKKHEKNDTMTMDIKKLGYRVAGSVGEVREYIGDSPVVAFDFETAPDDFYRGDSKASLDPARSHIVTVSISVAEGTAIVIPVAHKTGSNLDGEEVHEFLRKLLASDRIVKVAHNLSFESKFAAAIGIVIAEPVYDTLAAAQLTLAGDYTFRKLTDSGLKPLAKELFGEDLPGFEAVTSGKHFDELDPSDPETVRYSAADADFALRLYHEFNRWFQKFLPKHRTLVEHVESPVSVYLGIMNRHGVPVDTALMMRKKTEGEAEMERLRSEIKTVIGDVDIGKSCSTTDFKQALFGKLHLPVFKTTATAREAANDEAMQMLSAWCAKHRPDLVGFFKHVAEYRRWAKVISTYINGYLKYYNPVTGRIHPDFFALATETGRMSCHSPNCQNMPRKANDPAGVRNFIKAPEGHVIVSVDYSQIELRVGAFYCRDERMMETYRAGGDLHAETTSVIFKIPVEEAMDKENPDYKERRAIAKNVNFGVFFGIWAKGLQHTLKFKAGIDVSIDDCKRILHNLKAGYPGLERWQDDEKYLAERHMYTETWLGRRRYLPDIRLDEDWPKKSSAERCALNTPIQGTAADIIKIAMVRILRGLSERPWLEPILQIHDELVFIVPEEKTDEAVRFIRECMEQKPFKEFDLPLVAEASVGPDFGNMRDWENI